MTLEVIEIALAFQELRMGDDLGIGKLRQPEASAADVVGVGVGEHDVRDFPGRRFLQKAFMPGGLGSKPGIEQHVSAVRRDQEGIGHSGSPEQARRRLIHCHFDLLKAGDGLHCSPLVRFGLRGNIGARKVARHLGPAFVDNPGQARASQPVAQQDAEQQYAQPFQDA